MRVLFTATESNSANANPIGKKRSDFDSANTFSGPASDSSVEMDIVDPCEKKVESPSIATIQVDSPRHSFEIVSLSLKKESKSSVSGISNAKAAPAKTNAATIFVNPNRNVVYPARLIPKKS